MLEKVKQEWAKWTTLTPTNALYDRTLIWLFVILLMIGFVMVSSASISFGSREHQDPFYYAVRMSVYIALAAGVFAFFIQIPSDRWERYSSWLLIMSFILLVITLFIGNKVNGSVRWIALGPITIQSAEVAKFAIICYFASLYTRKFEIIRTSYASAWRPLIILAVFGALLMEQPDLGSTVVIFLLPFMMLFIIGAKLLQFFFLIICGSLLFIFSVLNSEYRLKRVTSFMDPFADYHNAGYQLANSQMAFGQGEIFGRGLGNSVQKLEYLPEAHTDFIMAIVAEEFGLIGILIILFLLCFLTFRAVNIGKEALRLEERFKGLFAFGIGFWIFIQGFVNLGVASGRLPTKGLTFPLVSYGGSSLIITAIAIAVLVRIDHENRLAISGQAHFKDD